MATEGGSPRMLSALVGAAAALTFLLAWPFLSSLVLAAVFAGGLAPAHGKLTRLLGRRPSLAAALLVVAVLFAFLLPLGGLAAFLLRETLRVAGLLQSSLAAGGSEAVVQRMPTWLQGSARYAVQAVETAMHTSASWLQALLQNRAAALAAIGGVFEKTRSVLWVALRAAVMLVALFLLLVDGAVLVDWLEDQLPLAPGELRALLREMRRVSVTVLRSTVLTGLVQSAVATVGYLVARAPQPFFFGLVTFFISLVPALGATIGALFVALVLGVTGHPWAGLFLGVWAVGVVAVVDNIVKPLFIRGGVDINGGVIFFALIGGAVMFGPVGIVAGPLIVAFLLAVLRLRARERAMAHVPVAPLPPVPPGPPREERPTPH